jgi:hypothetical protein
MRDLESLACFEQTAVRVSRDSALRPAAPYG